MSGDDPTTPLADDLFEVLRRHMDRERPPGAYQVPRDVTEATLLAWFDIIEQATDLARIAVTEGRSMETALAERSSEDEL